MIPADVTESGAEVVITALGQAGPQPSSFILFLDTRASRQDGYADRFGS